MVRSHELIPSEHMGRSMHLWRYGHFGMPVLAFPSAAGFAHEWESKSMVETLQDLIQGGRIKLYTTESNVAEAWTRREETSPEWRIQRHLAFERYVVDELVPWIRTDCGHSSIRIATTGCSLGAYYAANLALRHPEIFDWALCMSGRYAMTHFTDGFVNGDVYLNSPLAYVPNLQGEALERVRQTYLTMVCGQGAYEEGCIEETQALCDVFEAKEIPHQRDIWGHDVRHDWDWWRRQARYHMVRRFGG